MKNTIIALIVLLGIGGAIYYFAQDGSNTIVVEDVNTPIINDTDVDTTNSISTSTDETEMGDGEGGVRDYEGEEVIGVSAQERAVTAFTYGNGETQLLFVGGIHGGYSWNTALVAYKLIDYLEANPEAVPESVRVTVIPVLNPDGTFEVTGIEGRFGLEDAPASVDSTGKGRFNANNVDLNRNFDCDWQEEATWQDKTVSGGSAAFSEPESLALKTYIEEHSPSAVVVWYSSAGGVFSSSCHNGVLDETRTLTQVYADASGYKAYEEFNYYEITGDAVNWLAKEGVPAISVLLTTHNDVEWDMNKAGIEAVLDLYSE